MYSKPQLTSVFDNHSTQGMCTTCTVWCANFVCMFYIEYKHTFVCIYTIYHVCTTVYTHIVQRNQNVGLLIASLGPFRIPNPPKPDQSTDTSTALSPPAAIKLSQWKTKNINVSDRCGVLHQPLWWYTRLRSRHRDPVLQFISICSHNGPTVGHVVTMEDENTDRLLKLQFEQFVGWWQS